MTTAAKPISEVDPSLLVTEDGRYQPYIYWLETCGLFDFYDFALSRMGDMSGKHILDCGCGPGHTCVMFTRRGATAKGFDVDDGELDKARRIAEANGVEVDYSNQRFEEINYPDHSFDLAFGSCVIHHVDIDEAARQLGRVLKPGGKGIFIENSNRNPFLMLARSRLVGRFGVPKYGDDEEEHPLRDDEIELLRQEFPGQVNVHFPALVLFRLLDFYVFRRRSKLLTSLMRGLDKAIGSIYFMRRYSYFQIIEFQRD
ncbi:class I SAM-dependent methyltransferase [Primorskyibacter sp. S187A]|uniref:class I SAM-dependent methyltransferase n=1 Tax=Primorskyibacter sp. S187A TaxID=3415130 RepID=UPI003C7CEC53